MSGSTSEHAEPVGSRPDRPKPDLGRFAGEVVSGRPGPDAERLSGRRVALLADGDAAVELVPSLLHTTGLLKVFLTNPVWVLPEITLPSSLGLAAPLLQLPFVESVRRLVSDRVARATSGNPDDPFTPVAEWLAVVSLWFQVRDPWTRRQLTPDRRWDRPPVRFSNDFYGALGADGCELITWPVVGFSAGGVRTADGIEHRVDVVVVAEGGDA